MPIASGAMVELRRHGELVPPRVDDVLVSVSVGPSGEAIALWSTAAGRDRLLSHGPEPTAARVVTIP